MNRQMTVLDLAVVFALVIIAITLISASQWYATSNAPTALNLPVVQNGEWVVNESPVEIGTGSEDVEWSAPLVSNVGNQPVSEAAAAGGAQ